MQCTLESRHLGHEFLSDVLELRFIAERRDDPERSLWWSLLYALLQDLARSLALSATTLMDVFILMASDIFPSDCAL